MDPGGEVSDAKLTFTGRKRGCFQGGIAGRKLLVRGDEMMSLHPGSVSLRAAINSKLTAYAQYSEPKIERITNWRLQTEVPN